MSDNPRATDSSRATMDDVIAAYRLLLGRNPDESGLAHYKNLIQGGLTVDRLCNSFLESPEYKHKVSTGNAVLEIDCGGYVVCVRPGERDFGSRIVADHTWEPHIVKTLAGLLQDGDTFLDVGANVGVMTFCAALRVGPSGKVIALEPNPLNVQLLYAGALRNGFRNVLVLPLAFSDRSDIFSLAGGTSNTYLTSASTDGHGLYAQSIVADEYLSNLSRLDVVKMDIEGHEPFALNGLRHTLEKFRPALVLEFNPRCLRDVSSVDPLTFLQSLFNDFGDIRVIDRHAGQIAFGEASQLWNYWQSENQKAVVEGILADGMLHFDLLVNARKALPVANRR